ncbi:MAG TPA: carboxymuconolactone decarboxylase family protein [Dongiaceae bacterium]|nr:carboxymuconolactone decarboxylase family protein [Dongiaceae bacterium]
MRRQRTRHTESHHGPALLGVLARSPAALTGYLGLHRGLADGRLSKVERCLVALMVAQRSGSAYCLSVETRAARRAGLSDEQILAAREGCANSDRDVALLFLAGKLVINRGELAEADLAAVRQAGLSDTEVIEVIGHVALNLAAASVSHAARLKLDFPPAPPLAW